jgi:hypothetical protein
VHGSTLQLVGCPQCLAPAEITDRFVLESTSGPVEHLTVRCVNRHRFTITAEHLPSVSCRKPADAVPGATSVSHDGRPTPALPAAGLSP